MSGKVFRASLTRIADFDTNPVEYGAVARSDWHEGDYVLGEVIRAGHALAHVELANGRMAELNDGDAVLGALGVRHATLEAVGSWRLIGSDLEMQQLTSAGLFGLATSVSRPLSELVRLRYLGHAQRAGQCLAMSDFVEEPSSTTPFEIPTLLIVGTSMSAGKTTAAKKIIRQFKAMGARVVGAKLTGAGRYRDILGMADAGADAVFDFVDAGLPSTVVEPERYVTALRGLLEAIRGARPDVLVAEAGASPLEPYNGAACMAELSAAVRCIVLAASDPYAVVGVTQAFERKADLVVGLATSTSAGVELAEQLSTIPALNVLDPASGPVLRRLLEATVWPGPN